MGWVGRLLSSTTFGKAYFCLFVLGKIKLFTPEPETRPEDKEDEHLPNLHFFEFPGVF